MNRSVRRDMCLVVFLLAVPALTAMLVAACNSPQDSYFRRARNRWLATENLDCCKSNLRNIGTSLEMYSVDNGGRFPTSAAGLNPAYLKQIPTCPGASADTYTRGYVQASGPDTYTVTCSGSHHYSCGQGEYYPQYTSHQGLLTQ